MRPENLKALWDLRLTLLPYLAILGGMSMVLLAVLVDFIGLGGGDGFGARQIRLAILGLLISLVGVLTIPPVKEQLLFRWHQPPAPYQDPAQSVPTRMLQVMVLGMWFALVTSLVDLLRFADRKFLEDQII